MTETTQNEISPETQKWEWAVSAPEATSRVIRENIQNMAGFNEKQVRQGHILDLIRNDDIGAFNAATLNLVRRPEIAFGQKKEIIARINWELAQTATPKSVRGWLKKAKTEIEGVEWKSQQGIETAQRIWKDTVFANVNVMLDANLKGTKDAYDEFRRFDAELRKRNNTGS